MKIITKNKYILVSILLGGILLVILLLFNRPLSSRSKNEPFDNNTTPISTTTRAFIIPTINQTVQSACDNPTSIPAVCMNYDSCCGNNSIGTNSGCFCNHPFVKTCYEEFKKCQSTTTDETGTNTRTNKCQDILTSCCNKYADNDILSSNFNSPIISNQNSDKLCSLTGVANIEQRCMELCQTNPNCKSYSLITGGCTLYSSINNLSSEYNQSNNNSIYVSKK